jgi:hypothetical protein
LKPLDNLSVLENSRLNPKTNKIIKMKIWEGRSYLVGRYLLPYFFVTCKTKVDSISTTSLTKNSSFEKLAIDLVLNYEKLSIHQTHFSPKIRYVC